MTFRFELCMHVLSLLFEEASRREALYFEQRSADEIGGMPNYATDEYKSEYYMVGRDCIFSY